MSHIQVKEGGRGQMQQQHYLDSMLLIQTNSNYLSIAPILRSLQTMASNGSGVPLGEYLLRSQPAGQEQEDSIDIPLYLYSKRYVWLIEIHIIESVLSLISLGLSSSLSLLLIADTWISVALPLVKVIVMVHSSKSMYITRKIFPLMPFFVAQPYKHLKLKH